MSGLESGERVLELQANEGKVLLEQSGIKPATQPADGAFSAQTFVAVQSRCANDQ